MPGATDTPISVCMRQLLSDNGATQIFQCCMHSANIRKQTPTKHLLIQDSTVWLVIAHQQPLQAGDAPLRVQVGRDGLVGGPPAPENLLSAGVPRQQRQQRRHRASCRAGCPHIACRRLYEGTSLMSSLLNPLTRSPLDERATAAEQVPSWTAIMASDKPITSFIFVCRRHVTSSCRDITCRRGLMRAKGARGLPGGTRAACAASQHASAPLLARESATSASRSCAATSRLSVLSVSSAAAPWGPSLAASNACPD